MGRYPTRDWAAVAAGVLLPLAVAAVFLPLRSSWSNTNMALVLVVAVVAVAAMGNRLAGALGALSAAVWFDFFYTVPFERFTISRTADIRTAALLLVVGLAVSQLAARARRLKVIAITDARYLAEIHETAELAQTARSADAVIDHVRRQLIGLLDLTGCRFEYGTLTGHPARLEPDGSVMVRHHRQDVDEFGLPAEEIELRTFGNGRYFGRFMLAPKPGSRPSLQARLVAVTLADQAGRAFGAH
jgi:K+-sensing histidine kinase KdpD